ncbi:MAG: cytochrome b/b6 domain-containing protein [Candidatus Thiodiazotropha sp. (ex Lucinoma borealis)]|nr:cytochrome b/b6 domain-containing protein [Candidatus Thiodiazotropha sp. (ex Lucinoma borealis)]
MSHHRVFILPLWIRVWHWTNALLIITLAVTGGSLHFADPDLPLVPFELAAQVHSTAGLILVALYVFFVIANIVSGNWWQYVPKPGAFGEKMMRQTRYYIWGIFHGESPPYPPTADANFNAMQQIIYWLIMYLLMPLLLITGLIFTWPDFAPKQVMGMDGLIPVAVLHYLIGLLIVAFVIAHIYLGSCGAKVKTHYKMMITGWHEE